MAKFRAEQISEQIREVVSTYINKNTNGKSIISVTTVDINEKLDKATVFVTVLPEKEEPVALDFLQRKGTEIRKTVMKSLNIARIPFIEIKIDTGQKLFDRITEIEIKEKSS